MERRSFLKSIGAGCVSLAAGGALAAGQGDGQNTNPLAGVAIVDAHTHPDTFFGSRRSDRTSTLESIVALGMAASSFSAIGDRQGRERGPWQAESMHAVRLQLDWVRDLAAAGKVHLIRRVAEIAVPVPGHPWSDPRAGGGPSHRGRPRQGGFIGTWPLAYTRPNAKRETFRDWAVELLEMKRRLGVAHVGIGTDGGGGLPALIQGYRDVRDLTALARTMREVGFSPDEVAAVFGGNFRRVFEQAVG